MEVSEIFEFSDEISRAQKGSRELDVRIHRFLLPEQAAIVSIQGEKYKVGGLPTVLPYTTSLDAAHTAVPNGWLWTMDSWGPSGWSAGIWQGRTWAITSTRDRQSRSPALALASAAIYTAGVIAKKYATV